MATRRGRDDRQTSLLTELEGSAAERRARVRLALYGEHNAGVLESIVMYLDYADADGTGCRSFLDTMLERLAADRLRPVVLSRRTLQRYLARLRTLGLVRSWWHRGRHRNRVDWGAIGEAARGDRFAMRNDVPAGQPGNTNREDEAYSAAGNRTALEAEYASSSLFTADGGGTQERGAGSRQSGAGSRQSGAANMNSHCETELLEPPPPAPKTPDSSDDWDQVVVELKACAVGLATDAKRKALRAGFSPAECLAVIAHWRANRPAWEPGALYRRLVYVDPGIPPGDGWPKPSEAAQHAKKQQQRAAADVDRIERRQRFDAETEAAEAAAAELEARAGPALDNLAADELRALAKRVLPDALWRRFLHVGATGFVRDALLEEIGRESGASAECGVGSAEL